MAADIAAGSVIALAAAVMFAHRASAHRRTMAKSSFSLACTLLVVAGCGGTHGTTSQPDLAPSAADAGIEGQHGQLLDYFNLTPLVGFTVTDGDNTTTSDAQG